MAELDDAGEIRVEGRQTRERFVQREDVDVIGSVVGWPESGLYVRSARVVQRDALRTAAALDRIPRPRALHQNLAHRQRSDRQEVCAAVEVTGALAGEPDECFVDECGGLQCLTWPLSPDVAGGDPPQLVVDERHQLGNGVGSHLLQAVLNK